MLINLDKLAYSISVQQLGAENPIVNIIELLIMAMLQTAELFSFSFLAARVAFGVEVILGAFICGTKRPLKELQILDAGEYTHKQISQVTMTPKQPNTPS